MNTEIQHQPHGPRSMWSLLAVAVAALIFHGLYYNVGIKNLIDLGVVTVDSERILEGQVFGRDFIAPYGPGRYYLVAGLFKVFGTSMTVLCGLFWAIRVLVDVAAFLLARRLLPLGSSLVVTLCVATAHGPTHKGFLTLWLLLLIFTALQALDRPGKKQLFILGACTALAGTFRYDLGLVGVFLGLFILGISHWHASAEQGFRGAAKRLAAFLAGALLFALPLGALLLAGDPVRLMEAEMARAALLKDAQAAAPDLFTALITWTDPAGALLSLLLLLACPLVLVSAFFRWKTRSHQERSQRLTGFLVALAGGLLLSQYLIEPKINRLLQVGPPLFVCLFYLFHRISNQLLVPGARWLAPAVLLGVVGWYVMDESGRGSQDSPAVLVRLDERVEGDRAGFSTGIYLGEELNKLQGWIEKSEKEQLFYVSPSLPLLYFLTGRMNPAPITDFSYLLASETMQEWVLESLRGKEVGFYLYKHAMIQGFVPEKTAPRFFTELRALFPLRTPLPLRRDFPSGPPLSDLYRVYRKP